MFSNKSLLTALPFFKSQIEYGSIKKRRLDDVELLEELPFYEGLTKTKLKEAFKGYAKSYVTERYHADPLVQLRASRATIRELFN